jgi:hypothetical protein
MRWMGWLVAGSVACNGAGEEGFGPATCDGGGEPLLEAGVGGQLNFEAFGDGDLVPVRADGETIEVQLYTSGIDTTDSVTVVIKTSVGGGTTRDSINSFTLVCNDDEGRGWLGAYPFLPATAKDGDTITLSATVTDSSSVAVNTEVDLKLQF